MKTEASARIGHLRGRTIIGALFLSVALASNAHAAGQAAGLVHSINVNPGWGGFFVQLDNAVTANFEQACPFANWAFISVNEPFFKPMLAALSAAKASREQVTVYTDGCVTVAGQQVPHLSAVDYGIRNGS